MDRANTDQRVEALRAREFPAMKTTIVGGRPPGSGKGLGCIPRGIEVLVKKASVDPAFRQLLMASRSKAADDIGLRLDSSEAAMLEMVPVRQLEGIIAHTKLEPGKQKAFLSKAAAVMLVALGALTSDKEANAQFVSKGVQPIEHRDPPATQPATQPADDGPVVPVAGAIPCEIPPRPLVDPGLSVEVAGATSHRPPTRAPATLTTQQATDLPNLIEQLDAEQYTDRQEASRKIQEMGPGVIAPVQEVLKGAKLSPEVIIRLEAILKTARASTQPAPAPPPDEIRVVRGARALTPSAGERIDAPD